MDKINHLPATAHLIIAVFAVLLLMTWVTQRRCEGPRCRRRAHWRPDHQAFLCDTHAEMASYD